MNNCLKILNTVILIFIFISISLSQDDCIDSLQIDSIRIRYNCIQYSRFDEYDFQPVCGCDSITYNNLYCASASGVTKFENTPCSCIAANFRDTTKNIFYYISKILYPDPVRGCDGKVYLSPEMAVRKGGVTSYSRNSIPCFEQKYIDTTIDLSMFPDDQVCGCDNRNYRNKYEAVLYGGVIDWKNRECSCIDEYEIDTSVLCSDIYDPVCGCDRITYTNQCIAENYYGVQYTNPGECPCIDSTLIFSDSVYYENRNPILFYFYDPVCGCDSITYTNYVVAQYYFGVASWTDGVCNCIDSTQIDLSVECYEIYLPVKGCDGKLYKNACIARYKHGVMGYERAACYEEQQVDISIECNPSFDYDPVCGCDTITYPNECYAKYHAGITRWYNGECIDDTTCINKFLIDTFKYCSDIYDPVCGCDSITYTNECIAKYRNGVKSWTQGSCTTSTENINGNFTNTNFVNVFPIPFSNNITLTFSDNRNPELIAIYDMFGRKVKKIIVDKKTSKLNLSLEEIPAGIYFITIKTRNSIFTKKIVKISG